MHGPKAGGYGEGDEAARRAVDDGCNGQRVWLLPPETGLKHG